MKRHNTIDTENPKYQYYSRSLPHWFDSDKPIFITYRMKFTLPQAVVDALSERKTLWFKELQSLDGEAKQRSLETKDGVFFAWFDELLAKSGDLPHLIDKSLNIDRSIPKLSDDFIGLRTNLLTESCRMVDRIYGDYY